MEPSDEELLGRVGRGDRVACHVLVERYLGRLLRFAGRVLGDPQEAEDVVQETFARLWLHAARWRPGPARFSTWLHQVALNLCRDRLARRREMPVAVVPDAADPAPQPASRLEEADLRRIVGDAVSGLPDRQREALVLCHFQGFSNAEAAAVLGVGIEALESLLARARRTLRERLRSVAPELLRE